MLKATPLAILAGLLFTAMTALPAPASAGQSLWSHNGSTMLWYSNGQRRQVSYYAPRAGLSVNPGTVLFEGQKVGSEIYGTAYVFKRGCQPAPYTVRGLVDPSNQTHVVLYGSAPIRQRGGCQVVGYNPQSSNSRLEFNYLRRF